MNRSKAHGVMKKSNGKSEKEMAGLDLEHELTAGDGEENSAQPAGGVASPDGSETEKLKAERDSLLDRLARAQAEFENARRRSVKEQQDFRDYAAADAVKTLLPVVDSSAAPWRGQPDPAALTRGATAA